MPTNYILELVQHYFTDGEAMARLRSPQLLTVALSLGLAVACITRLILYPSVGAEGDALYYQRYAFAFRDGGFLTDFGSIRTYGYPAFLSLLSFISGRSHQALAITAGVVQYTLFLIFTLYLAARVDTISVRLAWAVRIGLLINPLVVALVVDSLTEGLTIPIAVLLVICALAADQSRTAQVALGGCILGALISAAALMVRPANISLVMAWHLSTSLALAQRSGSGKRAAVIGIYFLASVLVTAIVLMPQIIYNYYAWGEVTAFPVCRIGRLQLTFGLISLRYDSIVLNDVTMPYSYINPFFDAEALNHLTPLDWYFRHPLAGVATMVGHLFSAFSVNQLFTYLYDGHPRYANILLGFYWTVVMLGLAEAIISGRTIFSARTRQTAVFILASFVFIIGINAISAVELRFNVVPIAILSTLACLLVLQIELRRNKAILISALIIAAIFSFGSERLRSTGRLGPPEARFDLSVARCHLWKYP